MPKSRNGERESVCRPKGSAHPWPGKSAPPSGGNGTQKQNKATATAWAGRSLLHTLQGHIGKTTYQLSDDGFSFSSRRSSGPETGPLGLIEDLIGLEYETLFNDQVKSLLDKPLGVVFPDFCSEERMRKLAWSRLPSRSFSFEFNLTEGLAFTEMIPGRLFRFHERWSHAPSKWINAAVGTGLAFRERRRPRRSAGLVPIVAAPRRLSMAWVQLPKSMQRGEKCWVPTQRQHLQRAGSSPYPL